LFRKNIVLFALHVLRPLRIRIRWYTCCDRGGSSHFRRDVVNRRELLILRVINGAIVIGRTDSRRRCDVAGRRRRARAHASSELVGAIRVLDANVCHPRAHASAEPGQAAYRAAPEQNAAHDSACKDPERRAHGKAILGPDADSEKEHNNPIERACKHSEHVVDLIRAPQHCNR